MLAVALGLLPALSVRVAVAQAYTPPPPPLTAAPCVPTKKDPCSIPRSDQLPATPAETKFPFPGDAPSGGSAAGRFPYPGETPAATGTSPAPAQTPDAGAAAKYPYPGDPAVAPVTAGTGDGQSTPDASSSSSSSSAGDSMHDAVPDAPPAVPLNPRPVSPRSGLLQGRRPLPKVEDLSAREAEDVEVSKFYVQTGDYLGAYNRAKDAVRLLPEDSEAHWVLAVAADKMKKRDEAVAEYNTYVTIEPEGQHLRAAQAALRQLASK